MDDSRRIAWPDVPRICFGPGDPGHLNACVDWALRQPGNGARLYVHGYRRAAEALFNHVKSSERMSPDYILFPLAFLWRQHLELALKDAIATGREIDNEDPVYPAHHRLRDLWNTAKPYISVYGDADAPELANVEANIEEFEGIDPAAVGFRYSRDKAGTCSALRNPPTTINLAVLHEAMLALSNFFDGVHACQQQALDGLIEAESCR